MIVVRAEAGAKVGDGHIMRCLSLCGKLKSVIGPSTLITNDYASYSVKKWQQSFPCIKWNYEIGSLDDGIELRRFIIQNEVKILILDSYSIRSEYVKLFKNITKILLFDDLAERNIPVDLIINNNLGAERYKGNYDLAQNTALGLNYSMFRDSIISAKENSSRGQYLLVAFSNSQNPKLTYAFLKALEKLTFNEKIIVVAPKHAQKFYSQNVEWLAPTDLADIAARAKVCMISGGVILTEMLFLNKASIVLALAENQLPGIIEAEKQNVCLYARNSSDAARVVKSVFTDEKQLQKLEQNANKLFSSWSPENTRQKVISVLEN